MDFEEQYQILLTEKFEGKIVTGKPTITKMKLINPLNREILINFHHHYMGLIKTHQEKLSNYKNYRSKIIGFLLDKEINQKSIIEIEQSDIERYFSNRIDEDNKPDTYNSRMPFVQKYFDFCEDQLVHSINFNSIKRYSLTEIEEQRENYAIPLSLKDIDAIRKVFKEQPLELFVFEMLYHTNANIEDLRQCNIKNFDLDSHSFTLRSKIIIVPESLLPIIDMVKDDSEYFNSDRDYNELIRVMKSKLAIKGLRHQSFKPIDIRKTREEVSFLKCPECPNSYEAVAENWVIKQYSKEGEKWIVCKNCGGIV